jgi:imidazolonepropionase-like amidohydrolase
MRPLTVLLALVALTACAASPSPVAEAPAAPLAPATATVAAPTALPPTIAAPTPLPPTASPPAPTTEPPTATPLPIYDLVLLGGTLIDGTGAPPLPDAAIAITDGRVAAIGRRGELAYSPDTPVRDLAGATIMPGFIDAHAHTADLSDDELRAWARAGVTTLRDLGGPLDAVLSRRDAIAAGALLDLPRLVVSGLLVTVPGSFSVAFGGEENRLLLVEGPDDARAKLTALLDRGVDVIKIVLSGRTDISYAELSNAEVAAITEVARSRGIRVTAHVDRAVALRRAVENGVSDAAHSPRDRIPDDLIALMVERGMALVPTIDVYEALAESRGNGEAWRRSTAPVMYDNLRRFAAAGGTLALGSDYGGAPGMAVGMPMGEIAHWLAAGLSPMELIVAATRGGAIASGLEDEIGTLEVGKRADVLVVEGDPLADPAAFARPVLVLRDGRVVP